MSNAYRNSTYGEKELYTGIDLCKYIAAISVVLLHTIETSDYFSNGIKFVFTRWAVPFFFISSGFFLYRGLEKTKDKRAYWRRYTKNLLIVFGVWGVLIYSPFEISNYIANNQGASFLKIILLLIRRIFIIGAGPYWYLVALIWSGTIIYFCNKLRKEKTLLCIAIVGFLMQIFYVHFQNILNDTVLFGWFFKATYFIFSWENNFIMYGIPFCTVGYFIAKKNVILPQKVLYWLILLFTIGRVIEYLLPIHIDEQSINISIAFVPQAICIFFMAKESSLRITNDASMILRQLSQTTYFFHAIFLYEILNPLLDTICGTIHYSPNYILIKWGVNCLVCICLYVIVKKINNRYLNILIKG